MPDWLFDRSTVIALAILGGVCSLLASTGQAKGWLTGQHHKTLNKAAYGLMAASIVLFIGAGLFATA